LSTVEKNQLIWYLAAKCSFNQMPSERKSRPHVSIAWKEPTEMSPSLSQQMGLCNFVRL